MGKSLASRSGEDPYLLLGICETDCGALCLVMGSPEQEGCQLMDTKQSGQGTVAIGIQQKAKRAESTEVQKWQETTSVLTASI